MKKIEVRVIADGYVDIAVSVSPAVVAKTLVAICEEEARDPSSKTVRELMDRVAELENKNAISEYDVRRLRKQLIESVEKESNNV